VNLRLRSTLAIVVFFLCLSRASAGEKKVFNSQLLFLQPNASAAAQISPRVAFGKPSYDELEKTVSGPSAVLKFTEGTATRLRNGLFSVLDSALELDRAARFGVSQNKLLVQLKLVNDLVSRAGIEISRLFSASEEHLRRERKVGEEKSGRELADLNLYFEVRFRGKLSSKEAVEILHSLNQFEIIEFAAAKVTPAPSPASDIPPMTPNFTSTQTYLGPAPNGVDANYARTLAGGRGEGVRVSHIEQGWTLDHEDFPIVRGMSGFNSDHLWSVRQHGAAAIGEIAAVENGYGMTGISPAVDIYLSSAIFDEQLTYNIAEAVMRSFDQTRSGDVILLEQQVYYNHPQDTSLCPAEWDQAVFDAVNLATANGRVVVLVAGNGGQNGGQNLDDIARFGNRFQRDVMDTGAVYVGSANPTTHVPRLDTNYGTRVDVHAWGQDVPTLGYGDLSYPNSDNRQAYTSTFAGTSSAAPMVTGAAAVIQGIYLARGLPLRSSDQMRSALKIGGTPQGAGVLIGPQPDLRDAIAAIPVPSPTNLEAVGSSNNASLTWIGVTGVSGYEVFRKVSHQAAWTLVSTTPTPQFTDPNVTSGTTYLYRVGSFDGAGNRSADSNLELATTMAFTDPVLTAGTNVRAKHLIEARTAVNSICVYAGTSICPSPPFSGTALSETHMQTQVISASDFTAAQNQVIGLRSAIGASAAVFRETPTSGMIVRAIHLEDLRKAGN